MPVMKGLSATTILSFGVAVYITHAKHAKDNLLAEKIKHPLLQPRDRIDTYVPLARMYSTCMPGISQCASKFGQIGRAVATFPNFYLPNNAKYNCLFGLQRILGYCQVVENFRLVKMWSMVLVVGIVITASIVSLTVGILLAVVFERQRHRRHIEQHNPNAALIEDLENNQSLGNSNHCHNYTQERQSKPPLQTLSRTWITLPSSDTLDHDVSPVSPPPIATPLPTQKRDLRKILDGSIKKKSSGRRRLKKSTPLQRKQHTRWPVAEGKGKSLQVSTLSGSSYEKKSINSTVTLECKETNTSRQLLRTPKPRRLTANEALSRANSTGHSLEKPRPAYFPRSFSMASSVSTAPGEPLPPLPLVTSNKPNSHQKRAYGSSASIDSVGSSVLGSSKKIPQKTVVGTIQEPVSAAFQHFDFGLSPIMRLRSPVPVPTARYSDHEEPDLTAIEACVSSSEIKPLFSHRTCRTQPEDLLTTVPSVKSDHLTAAHRHSMFINAPIRNSLDVHDLCDENDPFATNSHGRSMSAENGVALQEVDARNVAQRSSVSSTSSLKRHRRQNCVRISNLPIIMLPKTNMDQVKIATIDKDSADGSTDSANKTLLQLAPTVINLSKLGTYDSSNDLKVYRHLQPDMDIVKTSAPSTPANGSGGKVWRFDFIPPNTPKIQLTPSPLRLYDSPILPPPAYHSANIHAGVRRSQVRGPRSPRGQASSPLRPKIRANHEQNIHRLSSRTYSTHSSSNDLRKSIQLLRSMNSEARFLNTEQSLVYRGLGSVKEEEGWSKQPDPQSEARIFDMENSATWNTPTFLASPPVFLGSRKISKSLAQSARSSTNLSRTSIWEDASVDGDTPPPETKSPVLTPATGNVNFAVGARASPVRIRSNHSKFQAAGDKSVVELERDKPVLKDENAKNFGLGILVEGCTVPDTPSSMYDESGFLRE